MYRRIIAAVTAVTAALFFTPTAVSASEPVDIVVLGGPAVIDPFVFGHLQSCTSGSVVRIAGPNRYATAAAASRARFDTAEIAYLVVGTSYPEAVAAGPVAALRRAPILLTQADAVPGETLAELRRLGVSRVILLGAPGSISARVEQDLATEFDVERIQGQDRYSTAAAISASFFVPGEVSTVYVARGDQFPDALAGGPAAVENRSPVLLTAGDVLPQATAAELLRLAPKRIVILGGAVAVSESVERALAPYAAQVSRLAGSNRFDTAAAVSTSLAGGTGTIYLATGDDFPDALASVPLTGGSTLLLVSEHMVPGQTANRVAAMTGVPCNPRVRIASFTTTFTAGQPRVVNIQTIARAADGAVVDPGATFSLNDHVGPRTEEKGYVPAPAIIGGEIYCCDHPVNIGGGTSQFATTLYNAIFYSGLDEVSHRPHSIYFSRYPLGIEATLGYPGPDVVFRNDTASPVSIHSSYTDRSVTVELWGWNEGRRVIAGVEGSATTTLGGDVTVTRTIVLSDGTSASERWWHSYKPLPPEME